MHTCSLIILFFITFGHSEVVRQQKCNYQLGLLSPPNCPFLLHRPPIAHFCFTSPLEFLTAPRGAVSPTLGTTGLGYQVSSRNRWWVLFAKHYLWWSHLIIIYKVKNISLSKNKTAFECSFIRNGMKECLLFFTLSDEQMNQRTLQKKGEEICLCCYVVERNTCVMQHWFE